MQNAYDTKTIVLVTVCAIVLIVMSDRYDSLGWPCHNGISTDVYKWLITHAVIALVRILHISLGWYIDDRLAFCKHK